MENSSVSTMDLLNSTTSESETEVESPRLSSAASLIKSTVENEEAENGDEKLDLVLVEDKADEPNKTTESDNDNKDDDNKETMSSTNIEPLGELEDIEDEIETSDLDHLEPKLRDAWIEMRRLDKKLAAVTKRAKKARLETLTMIESNKKDWENFKLESNYVESKLEAQITHKFYALSYPDFGDEDEEILEQRRRANEAESNQEPHTPVFKTQGHYEDEDHATERSVDRRRSKFDDAASKAPSNGFTNKTESVFSDGKQAKSSVSGGSKATNNSSNSNKDKDFIKRNIQLAKDNAGALAMTEEEKKRLKELLSDLTDPTSVENSEESSKVRAIAADEKLTYMVDYQPHLVELEQGDGFTPTREENEQLKRIDQQLQQKQSRLSSMIRYTSELEKLSCLPPESQHSADRGSHAVIEIKLNDEFNEDEFGDRFIREARMQREEELRLKYIDSKLKDISENQRMMILNKPRTDADSNIESIMNEENRLSFAEESSIDEGQIKQLIQEFYSEVGVEADNETVSQETETSKIQVLSETQLRNLLEELGVGETVSRADSRSTVHSYYDEALKIISESRTKLKSEFLEDRQLEDEEDNKKKSEDFGNDFYRDSHQLAEIISPLNNDETSQTPKLPPINQDSNQTGKNNQRPSSAISNASRSSFAADSTTSFSLPKIDDRYLQK